jgi:hypothetical protein
LIDDASTDNSLEVLKELARIPSSGWNATRKHGGEREHEPRNGRPGAITCYGGGRRIAAGVSSATRMLRAPASGSVQQRLRMALHGSGQSLRGGRM